MEEDKKVYEKLKEFNIDYEIVEHPAAMTTEEADSYIEGKEGVRTKTLFLSNKKSRTCYLIITDDSKTIDMKGLENMLQEKGLHFASAETLNQKLGLVPGSVSLFGILNNKEQDVKIKIDEDIKQEKWITFHPNINTKTLFLTVEDMYRFMEKMKYEYSFIKI